MAENETTYNRSSNESSDKPKYDRSNRSYDKSGNRKYKKNKFIFKKKVCFFCKHEDALIDYKDVGLMRRFISDSGKISPRRFTGTCAKHQRKLAVEIKKARQMALISYLEK